MAKTYIPTQKPKFRSTPIKAEIQKVERKPERYPVYQFTGRTFTAEDKPGRRPT